MGIPLRVLLVEDSAGDAGLIVRELQDSGYDPEFERVHTPEAFGVALAKETWDVVVADYFMPGFDGLDALAMVEESGLDLPFIIVSGIIGEDVAVAAMRSGAYDYVMKDRLARLGPAVRRALKEAEERRARRQAEKTIRSRAEELDALQATVLDITTQHDLSVLLQTIIERAARLLNALGGGMYLCDPDQRLVRCVVSYNTPRDYTGTKLEYGEGAAGIVAETGEPLIIDDYSVWPGRAAAYDEEHPFSAVLSVPMIWQGQVTGVIHVLHDAESRQFTQTDQELLTLFANHAAIAVENARLYEQAQKEIAERKRVEEALLQRNRELALVNQVNQALSSTLEPDQVLAVAMEEVCSILSVLAASIWLVDPETGELVCRQAIGPRNSEVRGWRLSPGEGIVGWVAEQGQSSIVPDTRLEEHHYKEVDRRTGIDVRSIVSLPLIVRENVIGVFQVVDTEVGRFSERDLTLLEPLVASVAVAFENARLYDQAQQEIAERKRVEAALRESEAQLWDLYENAPSAYFSVGVDGLIRRCNKHARELLGYSTEELVGKPVFELYKDTPQGREKASDAFNRFIAGETITDEELEMLKADGTLIWVSLTVNAVRDADGQIIESRSMAKDITRRKQAEEALRESEHRYRTLFDSASDAIFIHDLEGHFLQVNQAACERLGYSREELLQKTPMSIDSPEYAALVSERIEELRQRGHVLFEAAHVRRDGTTIPVELSSRVIEYAGGPAILSIARDITERVRSERERAQAGAERERLLAALARRSAQLQAAAEVSRAASSILDPDELIQRVVDLARERFGLYYAGLFLVDKSGKWIDEPGKWAVLWAATGEEGRQLVEQGHRLEIGGLSMIGWCVANKQARIALDVGEEAVHFSNPLLPETRSEVALPLISRGEAIGALTIQSSKPEAFSDEDVVALQTMADQLANAIENAWLYEQAQRELTERKRVEDVLRQYAAELEMRNEELDAFARTVAHDLKTPLGLLTGYTEVLSQEHATMPGEELQKHLHTMTGTALRMNNIIDELLLLSELREREVETVPLDMHKIVADAQRRLTGMIGEHQAEITSPEAWPTALGYGPWVEAVWANYISNAIKYGGQPPRVELGATPQPGGMVRFWVRDNGPGLTPEDQALLFTPFTRLDQVRVKGHGLGLSIVRRIVEKLGGSVGVESEGSQGSIFTFTLPGDNQE